MDLKQIKQIIDLMKRSDLSEFSLEEEGLKIKIKRGENGAPIVTNGQGRSSASPFPSPLDSTAQPLPATASAPAAPPAAGQVAEEPGVTYIKSPMVGTFYRSSSPESPPFVESGAKVTENTVVCIIEAMKIMNEIQAESEGSVVETLVANGEAVEYGQRLFKLKAA